MQMNMDTTESTGRPGAKVSWLVAVTPVLSGVAVSVSGAGLMVTATNGGSLALFNVAMASIAGGCLLSALGGYFAGADRQPKDKQEA